MRARWWMLALALVATARPASAQTLEFPGIRGSVSTPAQAIVMSSQLGPQPVKALIAGRRNDTLLVALRPFGFDALHASNNLVGVPMPTLLALSINLPDSRIAATLRGAARGTVIGAVVAPLLGIGLAVASAGAGPRGVRQVFAATTGVTLGGFILVGAAAGGLAPPRMQWHDVRVTRADDSASR